jgi:hypothetical protein
MSEHTCDLCAERDATIVRLRDDLAHSERVWDDAGQEIARLRAALEHVQQWHFGANVVCKTARAALADHA